MPLVTLKEILTDARKRGYGVPCLLGGSIEMVVGTIRAAEERYAPLILCFNEAITPTVPIALGMPLLVNAARFANVPVATILDHGTEFDSIVQAIYYGSSSVMFDGSILPYEENVRITQELRKITRAVGVSLEAELGSIGGTVLEYKETDSIESVFTDPDLAVDFVKRTEVDMLAISFGNVHGVYKGEPSLDLGRIQEIFSLVDVPLVMHGGSGLSDEDYPGIVASGISKINYYTAMARGAGREIRRIAAEQGEHLIYHTLIARGIDFFDEDTKRVLDLLGASGKADRAFPVFIGS